MKKKSKPRYQIILCVLIALVLIAVALVCYFVPTGLLPAYSIPGRKEGEMRIHFLDVGQSDCTIVEFPEGDVLIIDAGDGAFATNNKLVRYVKGLRPTSVSMLLTHADSDHYGGFRTLLKSFDTEKFYIPVLNFDAEDYQKLLDGIEKEGCPVETLTRYSAIKRECGAYLICLSPYSIGEESENDSSTVLYLDYGGVRALLCGDITATREKRLAKEYALDETLFDSGDFTVRLEGIEILKTAHHGSASSSSKEWLELIKPESAIISCGRGNEYSHPAAETLERLNAYSAVYRTDELGDVVAVIAAGDYTIHTGGLS